MQKKFDFFLEIAQFPLIILFTASILLGLGKLLINEELAFFWNVNGKYVILASILLRSLGSFIITIFPLVLLVFLLTKKYDDAHAGLLGIVSYFTLLLTTAVFTTQKIDSIAYMSGLGLTISSGDFTNLVQNQSPLQLGLIATYICYLLVKYCYVQTRNRRNYGAFSFIDKNGLALIYTVLGSILVGIIVSIVWPFIIKILLAVFAFIADDITNPFNLFLYGILEKFLGVLGLGSIPHSLFWFSEAGGSWLDSFGRKFVGDVGIWTAQMDNGVVTNGIGRFITGLYVTQIFALPGYIFALYTLYTNRFEKRKYFMFAILAMLVSIFMGNSFPFEFFMCSTTPLLFFIHIFTCGIIYALMAYMKVYVGYSFVGGLALATPGSLADLLVYFRSSLMTGTVHKLVIVGFVMAVLYFLATRLYYRYLAYDMYQSGTQKVLVDNIVDSLGGIENIKVLDSNPFKILVQVNDETKVNISSLRSLCNSKVYESKTGYVLYLYQASYTIYCDIMNLKKNVISE